MGWLGLPIIAFALAITSQTVLVRRLRRRHAIVAFVGAGIPIGLVLIVALFFSTRSTDMSISGTLIYAFLCELWMFTLSVTFSSFAAKLMMLLRQRPLTFEEIDRLSDHRTIILDRMNWLADIGAAVKQNDSLIPTGGGRKLARLFNASRSFFGHQ